MKSAPFHINSPADKRINSFPPTDRICLAGSSVLLQTVISNILHNRLPLAFDPLARSIVGNSIYRVTASWLA